MRVVIQRVSSASVKVEDRITGQIDSGLLILVGFQTEDLEADMDKMIRKICQLRIFSDSEGKMNLSVTDIGGSLLVVSQFTLYADCKKGNRPSYIQAAPPEQARLLYTQFLERLKAQTTLTIATGIFGADMKVNLLNDGPVTICLDSESL
jgi:D-tyrosyl-tRNA(Tyr) deacylase